MARDGIGSGGRLSSPLQRCQHRRESDGKKKKQSAHLRLPAYLFWLLCRLSTSRVRARASVSAAGRLVRCAPRSRTFIADALARACRSAHPGRASSPYGADAEKPICRLAGAPAAAARARELAAAAECRSDIRRPTSILAQKGGL